MEPSRGRRAKVIGARRIAAPPRTTGPVPVVATRAVRPEPAGAPLGAGSTIAAAAGVGGGWAGDAERLLVVIAATVDAGRARLESSLATAEGGATPSLEVATGSRVSADAAD